MVPFDGFHVVVTVSHQGKIVVCQPIQKLFGLFRFTAVDWPVKFAGVFGDGMQAYDFVYVVDCARANVAAMKADSTDRFYNVCTGKQTSISELAELLIRLTGSQTGIEYLPEEHSFVRNRIGDPTNARADLGFLADTELVDGLRGLIEWRIDHRKKRTSQR